MSDERVDAIRTPKQPQLTHTAASLPVALIAPVTLLPVHPASNYCPYLRVTACPTAAPASSELRWEGAGRSLHSWN